VDTALLAALRVVGQPLEALGALLAAVLAMEAREVQPLLLVKEIMGALAVFMEVEQVVGQEPQAEPRLVLTAVMGVLG
jgi:hypothetical protein